MKRLLLVALVLLALAIPAQAQFMTNTPTYKDSIGVDADDNGSFESYLWPAYLQEGANIIFTVAGDTLSIAAGAGGVTPQSITKTEIDTTSSNVPFNDAFHITTAVAESAYASLQAARKAVSDTLGVSGRIATGAIADQTITKNDIDTTASNIPFDEAFHKTTAVAESAYASLQAARKAVSDTLGVTGRITSTLILDQTIAKADIDTTSSNIAFDGAFHITTAVAESAYASLKSAQKAVNDTLGVTGRITSTTIADQTISKNDIDTTSSNIPLDGAYHITSAVADSAYASLQA